MSGEVVASTNRSVSRSGQLICACCPLCSPEASLAISS